MLRCLLRSVSFLPLFESQSLYGVCGSGNWGVDLQAGSEYGYSLLFCVLLAGLFAAFLQVTYLLFLLFSGNVYSARPAGSRMSLGRGYRPR